MSAVTAVARNAHAMMAAAALGHLFAMGPLIDVFLEAVLFSQQCVAMIH
jgi:hypothetical protein